MEEEEDASDPREGDEATGVAGDGEEDGGAEADDIIYILEDCVTLTRYQSKTIRGPKYYKRVQFALTYCSYVHFI